MRSRENTTSSDSIGPVPNSRYIKIIIPAPGHNVSKVVQARPKENIGRAVFAVCSGGMSCSPLCHLNSGESMLKRHVGAILSSP